VTGKAAPGCASDAEAFADMLDIVGMDEVESAPEQLDGS
jgi:hypothetical protein